MITPPTHDLLTDGHHLASPSTASLTQLDSLELQSVGRGPADDGWRLFMPRFDDDSSAMARLLRVAALPEAERVAALQQEIARGAPTNLVALRYRAAALILRDLSAMGWQVKVVSGKIYIRPHLSDGHASKEAIRRQLLLSRDEQLAEPNTRRFIHNLERPSRFSSCMPVTHLIADGRRLAERLSPIARLPREARGDALREVCQPYLQLATEERDAHTNIRLLDIWRYFRHTWTNRWRSMPGRNQFYLIRDAAQPYHPVMAITALGNAFMQLSARDNWLGWTSEGLLGLREQGVFTDDELTHALRRRLRADLAELYVEDLDLDRFGPDRLDDLLAHLRKVEEESRDEREDELTARQDQRKPSGPKVEDIRTIDLLASARSPLFRSKRARAARELLEAIAVLDQARGALPDLLVDDRGGWAVGQALRQLKKLHSATSMMEIVVCGAAPVYSHLLAGKLACLMMLSPRVVADYHRRYKDEYSIIASQMAGRPVAKPPTLVLLGTTSLFSERSSQYNRVALPVGALPDQSAEIHYHYLERTQGFGQPQLRSETEAALEELGTKTRSYRNVNFVFGEGQSPKLRQLREGFSALGLNSAELLRHGSNRIVYMAALVTNVQRFLLGIDSEPRYAAPLSPTSDEAVADFWRRRWLASRLDHEPALASVALSSPLAERVSRTIPEVHQANSNQLGLSFASAAPKEPVMPTLTPPQDERLEFIRMLYRDESAYSDNVTLGRLRELNIATQLERTLKRIIDAGASVVITGNAGDGKTHTIRLLETNLTKRGAEVIWDASEERPEDVVQRWARTRAEGRPFCIAINEGPLVDLIRAYRGEHPWLQELREQLFSLVRYEPITEDRAGRERWEPQAGETYIIDLSLRQTLSRTLIRNIVKKVTEDRWYEGCSRCPNIKSCGVTYNRTLLQRDLVLDRITSLLERVAERGVRATFRESLAFASFLVFGGSSCEELCQLGPIEGARYYSTAFEGGQGALFEEVNAGLDPVTQTDPMLDEALWRGRVNPAEFAGVDLAPPISRDLDDADPRGKPSPEELFAALKRRWYFEHGGGVLRAATEAEETFQALKDNNISTQMRIGRILKMINEWWNPSADSDEQDMLRLWTRLAYSPKSNHLRKTMVSGRAVSGLELTLYRPRLAPAVQDSFGDQPEDHLLLAPVKGCGVANLRIDTRLLMALHLGARAERDTEIEQRLSRFNDAMARFADKGQSVRKITIVDAQSDSTVHVRVDLEQKRYDSIS